MSENSARYKFKAQNSPKIKPNLIESKVDNKINEIINKHKEEDYWEPTKTAFEVFYDNYIKGHGTMIFFIVLTIIFLLYRYRMIQNDKINKMLNNEYVSDKKKINYTEQKLIELIDEYK